jgi:hydrogenase-4 component E
MNPGPLNVGLLGSLSLLMVITSVIAVEARALRTSATAYCAQALLIVALLLGYAAANPALYWWAATAFLTKAVLTPWFLFRYIGRGEDREVRPLIGFAPSVVVACLLMIGFYRLTHSQFALFAPGESGGSDALRTNLAVASTVFVLGLYSVLTRRDAVKTVIGLCLLENGVHLSLVSLAPGMPETALFGIATEVVVTVFLLLYVIAGVRREFGTTDTFRLRELQR